MITSFYRCVMCVFVSKHVHNFNQVPSATIASTTMCNTRLRTPSEALTCHSRLCVARRPVCKCRTSLSMYARVRSARAHPYPCHPVHRDSHKQKQQRHRQQMTRLPVTTRPTINAGAWRERPRDAADAASSLTFLGPRGSVP